MRRIAIAATIFGVSAVISAAAPVPRPAPELTLSDASHHTISPASYAGKVVLLQFLYTTCQHCQATSRTFTKIQNELGPRGLQVLGVAFNEEALSNADALRAYANANGVTFPICIASREAVLNYLGISFMSRFVVPQIVLIDRQGVIRAQSDALGSQELMDEAGLRPLLERLIAEPARAAKSAKRQPLRSDLRNR